MKTILFLSVPCALAAVASAQTEVHASQVVCPANTASQVILITASSVGTVAGMPIVLTRGVCAALGAGFMISTPPGNTQPVINIPASVGPVQVNNEILGGTIDGTNTTFSVLTPPIAGTTVVYRNGIRLTPSFNGLVYDYSLTGNSITFVAAQTPQPTDTLVVDYQHN